MRACQARHLLGRAMDRMEAEDRHLLKVNVSERCIAARLAMYLREYFSGFDVDVEYNREGVEVKRLRDVLRDCPRDRDNPRDRQNGRPVLPDVIVHRRCSRVSNLLVIEMKKEPGTSGIDCDRRRIKAFQKELDYKFGALVVCKTGEDTGIFVEWYPEVQ